MIEQVCGEKEWRVASLVASVAELIEVRLAKVVANGGGLGVMSLEQAGRISLLGPNVKAVASPGRLFVVVGVKLIIGELEENDAVEGEESPEPAEIEVHFMADYTLPDDPPPELIEEEGYEPFAKLNGVTNLWPYLRQEVQNLSGAMGCPVVIPLFKAKREPPPKAKGTKKTAKASKRSPKAKKAAEAPKKAVKAPKKAAKEPTKTRKAAKSPRKAAKGTAKARSKGTAVTKNKAKAKAKK